MRCPVEQDQRRIALSASAHTDNRALPGRLTDQTEENRSSSVIGGVDNDPLDAKGSKILWQPKEHEVRSWMCARYIEGEESRPTLIPNATSSTKAMAHGAGGAKVVIFGRDDTIELAQDQLPTYGKDDSAATYIDDSDLPLSRFRQDKELTEPASDVRRRVDRAI